MKCGVKQQKKYGQARMGLNNYFFMEKRRSTY